MIVVSQLYGLKSTGSSWRAALAQVLKDRSSVSKLADPDVWIREAFRKDSLKYYEMIFVYVENILAVSHNAMDVIK